MLHKASKSIEMVLYCFSGSPIKCQGRTGQNIDDFDANSKFPDCHTGVNWWMAKKWCTTLEEYKRGALLFFKVICQISRSHGPKTLTILTRIESFRTVNPVWIHRRLWIDVQSLRGHGRGILSFFEVILQISRSHRQKKTWQFWPKLSVSGL